MIYSNFVEGEELNFKNYDSAKDEIITYTFLIDFLLFSSQNGSYIVHLLD